MEERELYSDLMRQKHNAELELSRIDDQMRTWRQANRLVSLMAYRTAVILAATLGSIIGVLVTRAWIAAGF